MRKVRLLLLSLFAVCCIQVMGQSRVITGKVTDSLGHGLPGVTVRVKMQAPGPALPTTAALH